ncbi:MAG: chromosome segregation protein SMC [Deltaproteobacteria bacterium]|nr:chromosome segregation protein SMC [Deltaproteobacteria bacterium]
MRIKKLEIHGFKSFADRVVLSFGDGITGVVGPNGCGKSNVVDAIRWCMGEMSAKHLRGRAMQDVIFAGSDSRGPTGIAEVTLTFHNDGNAPPQYAVFSEIAVTRRLHRDGSSEYIINKVPARLRDITDLFLGTGAGTRAYSIIEQGRIGFVVSARPEDRRSLIEEVASITKFKARKKAAERRFEATEQNLRRVNDIVSELERQLGSLRRQARKAERYKELREELRDLELHGASLEYLNLGVLEKVQEAQRVQLESTIEDLNAAFANSEAGLEIERLRLTEEERVLMASQQTTAEMDARIAALERDLSHWKSRFFETKERIQTACRDLEEARVRLTYTDSERVEAQQATVTYEQEANKSRELINAAASALIKMQTELSALDVELDMHRKDALEHVHGAAQGRAHAKNLERQRVDVQTRLENASSEQQDLQLRRAETQRRCEVLAQQFEQLQTDLTNYHEQIAGLREQLNITNAETDHFEALLQNLRDQLGAKRSRLESLQEIARRFEGYSDGVRSIFGACDEHGTPQEGGTPVVAGIRALVSDVLNVTSEYERAIEAALGNRVQYLIVDSIDDGAAAIAFLQQTSSGQSGFIPIAPRQRERWSAMAVPEGVLGVARSFVSPDEGYEQVADYLLSEVLIVDNIDIARRLFAAGVSDERVANKILVTISGEVIDIGGVITGGSVEGAGLLQKRREIRELAQEVEQLTQVYQTRKAEQEDLETQRLQLEIDVQQLDKDIHEGELERVQIVKDKQAAEKEHNTINERLEVLAYELTQRCEELAEIDTEERTVLAQAVSAEAGREQSEAQLAFLSEQRRTLALKIDSQSEELTEAKVQLAAHEEKLAAAKATVQRLATTHKELANRIERDDVTMGEGEVAAAELEQKITQGSEQLSDLVSQTQMLHTQLNEARGRYETERAGIGDVEQKMRSQRNELDSMREKLLNTRMEIQRLNLERQRLIDQVAERYDVVLATIITDYHLRSLPGTHADSRRGELDRAIRAMGPINLTAIEECAEIEGRHTFLVQQRDDLQSALDSLKRAITRINRQSRERFRAAFDAVNEMFQQVFPRLFRGGEARLELVENGDVLEAGVDIIAQPPGKKLQNVGLLSGGEKALTATALVFSIFLIKPSPFCVLDEVDAPLDEANVGRFNQMLQEISKLSQFIVITHNKLTMSEADRLYGITMEEPGMSKVVSVDLSQQNGEVAA